MIDPNPNENWEVTEHYVHNLLRSKLGIGKSLEIERAHRVGQWMPDRTKPRDIVIKFLRFKDREEVLSRRSLLKDSGIFINEDYCKNTIKIRKDLRSQMYWARKEG